MAGYIFQICRENIDARQELNVMSILNRTAQYEIKWLEHFNQMDDCRIHKQLLHYKLRGQRGVER